MKKVTLSLLALTAVGYLAGSLMLLKWERDSLQENLLSVRQLAERSMKVGQHLQKGVPVPNRPLSSQ
jgi:hypothetical protein